MFGKYFYNKNIRNIVILFGTLFNDITIRRTKSDGTIQNTLKVPIAYGPAKKYLTRLEQGPPNNNTEEKVGMVLPRMSFEIITMAYDGTRKLQTTKKIREVKPLGTIQSINIINGGSGYTVAPTVTIELPPNGLNGATATATVANGAVTSIVLNNNGLGYTSIPNVTISGTGTNAKATANVDSNTSSLQTAYTPVPYDFEIDLSIMVLNSDDGTQILEQILPYFTPEFQVTMNEMKTLGIKRDIPIVLNSLTTADDYEGDFLTRRSLVHTLSFTVQGYLYGPIEDQGIIREVDVNAGTTTFDDIDTQLVNIDTVPNPVDSDPEDNPSTTTTITDL
jgi:hypothetical protein